MAANCCLFVCCLLLELFAGLFSWVVVVVCGCLWFVVVGLIVGS